MNKLNNRSHLIEGRGGYGAQRARSSRGASQVGRHRLGAELQECRTQPLTTTLDNVLGYLLNQGDLTGEPGLYNRVNRGHLGCNEAQGMGVRIWGGARHLAALCLTLLPPFWRC
jgi:hypothetical protein